MVRGAATSLTYAAVRVNISLSVSNSAESPTDALFAMSGLRDVYYANSYICRPRDVACVTSWSTHEGDRFPASVRVGRTVGVQFHPEKSSSAGVAFVHAFLKEMLG